MKVLKTLTAFPNVVGRFHALHALVADPASDVVPFSLLAQNRSAESQQLYMLLMRLARNGLWQLIGATMRPAKPGRSPLCRHLNRLLEL